MSGDGRVVAWLHHEWIGYTVTSEFPGAYPVVPLSALQAVEQRATHAETQREAAQVIAIRNVEQRQAAEQRNAELVAGLVGLADEWRGSGRYLHSQIMRDCVADLRNLAAASPNDRKES